MSLTSSGSRVRTPPTRSDLATILQRVIAKLNAYDGVTATVEPVEIPVKPGDADRVNEALRHGNAVTFTAPQPRRNGRDRRRQVPRRRSRERRPGARRASSSSRTSSADPGGPDPSDEPEPPASGRRCAAPWCEHLVYGPPKRGTAVPSVATVRVPSIASGRPAAAT